MEDEERKQFINEYCKNMAKPMTLTNDDWRRKATTEEFADWVVEVVFGKEFKKHIEKMGYINMHSCKTEVVSWLNEPK
jgi:hypothetical protein